MVVYVNYTNEYEFIGGIKQLDARILHATQKVGKHKSKNGAARARQRLSEQKAERNRLVQALAELKLMKLLNRE